MIVQAGNRRGGQTGLSPLPRYTAALGVFISLALTPTPARAALVVGQVAGRLAASCPAGDTPSGPVTHATVQAAVDEAMAMEDPNPVIEICSGIYRERVTVNDTGVRRIRSMQSLIIIGVGPSKSDVVIFGAGVTGVPIINVVAAAAVDIKNLTVDGQSMMVPAVPRGEVVGIRYGLVPGTISNVSVLNIGGADGKAQGIGILAEGQDLATFDPLNPPTETLLQLLQVMVMNTTRVGILADGQGINIDVRQSMLTGPDAPSSHTPTGVQVPPHAPNGVQVSRGAKGSVSGSEISNFKSPTPSTGAGSGITFLCPGFDTDLFATAQQNTGVTPTSASPSSIRMACASRTIPSSTPRLGSPCSRRDCCWPQGAFHPLCHPNTRRSSATPSWTQPKLVCNPLAWS